MEYTGYKAANIKKYSGGQQRLKFQLHPSKLIGLERFKRNAKRLVGQDEIVLDNAGGSGMYTDIIRQQGITDRIYAVDLSPSVLAERNPKDISKVGDMENLPYEDGFFDRVLFIAALHHVGDTKKALDEAWRVLKPGGRVTLEEPTSISLRFSKKGIRPTPDGVEFAFSLPYVLRHLKESGFEIERVYHQGFLFRFLPKSNLRLLQAAEKLEELIDAIPVARNLAGFFSNTAAIIARKKEKGR